MNYLYGTFSDSQIEDNAQLMHGEIHKLLLQKDPQLVKKIFQSDAEFLSYFRNLLYRFGGLNELLKEPTQMVSLMATLQAAYNETQQTVFHWDVYRRLILDAHAYIKSMFEEAQNA